MSINNIIKQLQYAFTSTTTFSVCRFGAFPSILCVQEEEEAAHTGLWAVDLKPAQQFIWNQHKQRGRQRPHLLRDEHANLSHRKKVWEEHWEIINSN